jgi:uncharacterized protein YyaL (SSP411 family)
MRDYLALARQTQHFTYQRFGCRVRRRWRGRGEELTFRRSEVEPRWTDLWYVATQLGADAELARIDPSADRRRIASVSAFVARFWWDGQLGYLARGRPDGKQFFTPDRYCDDHGHLGLMLLQAWRTTADEAHLERARRAASYLLEGRVCDEVFGGGLWWNSRLGDSTEGKPAQTNALAVQLFAELHEATGELRYLEWAHRLLDWLDATLWDEEARLYRWSVHYADPAARRGRVLSERFFNYDQAIAIDALLALRRIEGQPSYLERARAIAARLEAVFWRKPEGGFNLVAGVEHVMPVYSAWLTNSLLALHRVDADERWLELARRNVDAMDKYLRTPDGGYYEGAGLHDGRWTVKPVLDQVACAGMQRALVALASVAMGRAG